MTFIPWALKSNSFDIILVLTLELLAFIFDQFGRVLVDGFSSRGFTNIKSLTPAIILADVCQLLESVSSRDSPGLGGKLLVGL